VQDYRAHLTEQLDFLRSSAAAYDAGGEHYAKQIAVHIRTLVHDKGRSVSVLSHLGVKDKLGFVDTAAADPPPPPTLDLSFGLCLLKMTLGTKPSTRFVAPLAETVHDPLRQHPRTCFKDWWGVPLLRDTVGNEFSRSDLVLSVCDQDGGAHIDSKLNAAYQALARENSIGITDGAGQPLNSVALASVRQIAYEMLQTLDAGLAWHDDQPIVADPVCPLPLQGARGAAGRNERCACGSGKKMKVCFGARRPRRAIPTPESNEPLPTGTPAPDGHDEEPAIWFDRLLFVPIEDE
jgi:hypothetical protein